MDLTSRVSYNSSSFKGTLNQNRKMFFYSMQSTECFRNILSHRTDRIIFVKNSIYCLEISDIVARWSRVFTFDHNVSF